MTKWFEGAKTVSEVKKRYRELVMQYHPDRGGNEQSMKEITDQFPTALSKAEPDPEGTETESPEKEKDYEFITVSDDTLDKLATVCELNVEVELIGSFIWVWDYGPHEIFALTMMGFTWSKKYNGFFWADWDYIKKTQGEIARAPEDHTADKMRRKFGSERKKKRGFI